MRYSETSLKKYIQKSFQDLESTGGLILKSNMVKVILELWLRWSLDYADVVQEWEVIVISLI